MRSLTSFFYATRKAATRNRVKETKKNMANQWFKFYGAEYLSDPKMDRLTVQERSCWLTLLCMASQSNGVIKFLSVEGLLNKSGIHFNPYETTEWENSQNVLRTFVQYEMIKVHENGNIEVNNWEKRQEHNLTVAERVAKSRANKKNVTTDVTNVTTEENRIEENRIDINTTSQSSVKGKTKKGKTFSPTENAIYTAFRESVNENIYDSVANWKMEREACKKLESNYSLQIVLNVIRNVLPKTNLLPGMPQIYTPAKLLEKWAQLSQAKDRKINEVKKQQDKLGKVYL